MRALLALLAALALLFPDAARAEERIHFFLSDVAVEPDGTLAVTETIRVEAEGNQIRRGIYRDFPTRYKGRNGEQKSIGFEVVAVRRDGQPEPWTISSQGNGVRVLIGDANVFIPYGLHEYHIDYRTTRQLGYFDKFDELYWNATGNGWGFPIDLAEARIKLPAEAAFVQSSFYTGLEGTSGQDAMVVSQRPGQIVFRTTRPLAPYEGLTVAAAWPKGVVAAPSQATRLGWWLADYGPPAVALAGLAGVLGFYFHAWRRAGRGPRAGTIVPIFAPPDDLSAAGARYIREMGSDNRAFAAALVQLGVLGKLRLVEGEKGFFTRAKTTIEKTLSDKAVPAPEAAMLESLFRDGDAILMDNENHKTFSAAQKALGDRLKDQYEGPLFLRNWSWSLRGLLALVVAIWLTAAALVLAAPSLHGATISAGVPLAGLGALAVASLLYTGSANASSGTRMLARIVAAIIGLIALGFGLATIGMALEAGRILPLLVPLVSLPIVISAFWWMAAPTKQGREVMDRIAGFRQYLSITEEERLESMHPPEKTPELFEKYLPYAIALDVENEWASRFTRILAAAAAAAGTTHTMSWYSGHSDPWSDTDGFVDRMGSSLTSTISSSSTAPGSSSGSGGGGSSGGGGGGGGGGGW